MRGKQNKKRGKIMVYHILFKIHHKHKAAYEFDSYFYSIREIFGFIKDNLKDKDIPLVLKIEKVAEIPEHILRQWGEIKWFLPCAK